MIKLQNITLENWDNLIILDACRFDFFNKVYKDYLDGKLEKRISEGSSTPEWLAKTFTKKYDYTYISANPFINSQGLPLNKCRIECRNYSWNAINHFSKIIDVWEFGWNNESNTVHPREVNIAYLSNKDNNKTIIHYDQPHTPYLSYDEIYHPGRIINKIKDAYYKFYLDTIFDLRRHPFIREMILKLFKSPDQYSPLKKICIELGMERLLYYYEDNLRIVLSYVSQLMEELNGKTIITADHGEAFGENGIWGHQLETHIPVLIEVPWLEVKS